MMPFRLERLLTYTSNKDRQLFKTQYLAKEKLLQAQTLRIFLLEGDLHLSKSSSPFDLLLL